MERGSPVGVLDADLEFGVPVGVGGAVGRALGGDGDGLPVGVGGGSSARDSEDGERRDDERNQRRGGGLAAGEHFYLRLCRGRSPWLTPVQPPVPSVLVPCSVGVRRAVR